MNESRKTTGRADTSVRRTDGSATLSGESGNPHPGVGLTPDATGLIVRPPAGPPTLNSVPVRLGHQQCGVLVRLASATQAGAQ